MMVAGVDFGIFAGQVQFTIHGSVEGSNSISRHSGTKKKGVVNGRVRKRA
jgi:hypothetical protein